MTASQDTIRLAEIAALAADEKQASNIAVLDVSDVMAISEVFVLASADNERQARAIVEVRNTASSSVPEEGQGSWRPPTGGRAANTEPPSA